MNAFDQLQVALIIGGRNLPRELMEIIAKYYRCKMYIINLFSWQISQYVITKPVMLKSYGENTFSAIHYLVRHYPKEIMDIIINYNSARKYQQTLDMKYVNIFGDLKCSDWRIKNDGSKHDISSRYNNLDSQDNTWQIADLLLYIMERENLSDQIYKIES